MESSGVQTVPNEETHCSLYVLSPGASHCIPYRRPNHFPLVQSSLLQLKQNAVDLPACPSRLAVKNREPSSWAGPCGYDTSLYSLPRPRHQHTSTEMQSTKECVASVGGLTPVARHHDARVSMEFPCDLESSFHSGLLNSSTLTINPSNPTERETSAAGTCALVPTISDDPSPSGATSNDLEQEFYSTPTVKHSSSEPIPTQADSVLPLLFYPRRKSGQPMPKKRKVMSK